MSISTGIDIVHIPTFTQSLLSGGQVFKDKLFNPEEQSTFTSLESLAGIFSVKEAVIKALADHNLTPSQIHISKNHEGRPELSHPKVDPSTIDISISHHVDYAVAICVILKP